MSGVKTISGVLGLAMLIMGGIWVLQGLNVSWAPQSFMTADINWTYRGIGFALVGAVLLLWSIFSWRDVLGAVGALTMFIGAFLAAQAVNLLPGMAVSGNMDWAVRGGVAGLIGLVLVVVSARRRPSEASTA